MGFPRHALKRDCFLFQYTLIPHSPLDDAAAILSAATPPLQGDEKSTNAILLIINAADTFREGSDSEHADARSTR